jgi:hypothetical protein
MPPPPPPGPDPYAPPTSGQPYAPPTSGQPYAPPTSGQPYGQPGYGPPTSGQPYGQPGYGPPTSGQPYGTEQFSAPPGYPTQQFPGQPGYPPGQPGFPPGQLGYPQPPKKKRGLMITLIVVAIVVVLCGGGGTGAYFLVNNVETGKGQASPTEAVQAFLRAVYVDKDVDAASKLVCAQARDKNALTKKINELKSYEAQYKGPTYTWAAPTIQSQNKDTATVTADVKFNTSDDRQSEQKLTITTTKKSGWWVCEVRTG